jgi:hypothetical protein
MRGIRFLLALFIVMSFSISSYSADEKQATVDYLKKANPIIMDVDLAYRNVSMGLWPLSEGVKRMAEYIEKFSKLHPTPIMQKEHKMMLLGFKKIRTAYYLLDKGNKEIAGKLIKSGANLLKLSAGEMREFVKRAGLYKKPESNKAETRQAEQ